jgi:hypothetical protein
MQPDPMGIRAANLSNPQSLNRYAYVTNDAINKVDPLGLFAEEEYEYEEDYFDGGGGGGGGWFCSGCTDTPGEGDVKWFDSWGDVPDGYVEYDKTTAVGWETGLDYILGPNGEITLDILPLTPDNTIHVDSSEQELTDFAKGVVNQLGHELAGTWPLEKAVEIELMLFGGPFVEEAALTDLTIEGAGGAVTEGTETFFRTMSQEHYDTLEATGKVPASSETFISPSLEYVRKYDGVTVQFNVQAGTRDSLLGIGVRNGALNGAPYSSLPLVESGWTSSRAFFKLEGQIGGVPTVNIGLGRGAALDTFNNNIVKFTIAPKP